MTSDDQASEHETSMPSLSNVSNGLLPPRARRGRPAGATTQKRARKSRAKTPLTIAGRLMRMAQDGTRAQPEAFDLHTIGDRFARIERLATRAIEPVDALDAASERGYLYFQALLADALR